MKIHPISSAFHEAGHFVAANVLGYRVDLAAVYAEPLYMGQASLLDEKMYELGGVNILWPSDISGRERDVIMVDLAGPAAAMRRAKKWRPIQTKIWADDLGQAILMATRIASTHEEGETLINDYSNASENFWVSIGPRLKPLRPHYWKGKRSVSSISNA